jgi:NAD+ synthase (glutamine-hydrolysing)
MERYAENPAPAAENPPASTDQRNASRSLIRLALAQLNFTVGAFEQNFAKIATAVARAVDTEADLVVFSEMATTGYPPRDLLNHTRFIDLNLASLDRVAALSTDRLGILIGFVDRNPTTEGKALYNAAALCHNGRIVGRYYKALLPTYDVFDEDRYFEPGRTVAPFDLHGVRLGVTICEDVWNDKDFWPRRLYHRDPVCELADHKVDLLINISASPFTLAKPGLRRDMIRQEAVKHRRHFFYLNQVGGNDELIFDGHSIGIDPNGQEVVRAKEFEEDFVVYDVPVRAEVLDRASGPVLRSMNQSVDETAYGALVLGLRDYARKCGFSKAVLGLSGGIDSAITACLAAAALGPQNVLSVAMPSRYSSPHSLTDAAALARNLGIEHRVIPIDDVFQAYLDALAPTFADRSEDVTEENLQARTRGAVLMALSNKLGCLLLSTGNKSELAVGYCTLYGDMAGGLAVINDVPKTLVYRIANFINRDREVIPSSTLIKAPSAELRTNQRDTDTLPPYDVLDPIIEAYVERDFDVESIPSSASIGWWWPISFGGSTGANTNGDRRRRASRFHRRPLASGGGIPWRPTTRP